MDIELKINAVADDFEFIDGDNFDFLEVINHGRDDNNVTLTISRKMFKEMVSKYNEKYNEEEWK